MKYVLLSLALTFSALAEEKMDPKKQEMMKKMMEYGTPGEQHKMLAQMEGKWTYTSKMWETPESKPDESTGTSTMKMVMGGRYLQQEVKGSAMGQPFEGMGLTGYDNLKKEFDTVWVDTWSTGIMEGKGQYNAKTKTLTDKGEFTCPMEKDHEAEYRSEWTMPDKNNSTFVMYRKNGKKEDKMMEMTYKRVQ